MFNTGNVMLMAMLMLRPARIKPRECCRYSDADAQCEWKRNRRDVTSPCRTCLCTLRRLALFADVSADVSAVRGAGRAGGRVPQCQVVRRVAVPPKAVARVPRAPACVVYGGACRAENHNSDGTEVSLLCSQTNNTAKKSKVPRHVTLGLFFKTTHFLPRNPEEGQFVVLGEWLVSHSPLSLQSQLNPYSWTWKCR